MMPFSPKFQVRVPLTDLKERPLNRSSISTPDSGINPSLLERILKTASSPGASFGLGVPQAAIAVIATNVAIHLTMQADALKFFTMTNLPFVLVVPMLSFTPATQFICAGPEKKATYKSQPHSPTNNYYTSLYSADINQFTSS